MRRQNSRAALEYIERTGILGERRTQTYQCGWHHGPITTREIFERVRVVHPQIPHHSFTSRPSELADMGLFVAVGDKPCQHTGRTVTLWDVTDKIPTEPYKHKRRPGNELQRLKDQVRDLQVENGDLRDQLRRARGGEQRSLF